MIQIEIPEINNICFDIMLDLLFYTFPKSDGPNQIALFDKHDYLILSISWINIRGRGYKSLCGKSEQTLFLV